jgi:hypothetical protein
MGIFSAASRGDGGNGNHAMPDSIISHVPVGVADLERSRRFGRAANRSGNQLD